MADRNVPTTATIETFRTTYNLSAVDIGNIADLNDCIHKHTNRFSGGC